MKRDELPGTTGEERTQDRLMAYDASTEVERVRAPVITFERIYPWAEATEIPLFRKMVDGNEAGIVRTLPAGYCGRCGEKKPADRSCGCFDNDCQ